ncbi:tropomyosin-like, partial [Adelges cooleyi]|uniref:tropomyosin-like n=1 Tax=Adelges cooleyi TaxID=133065 RepID=UPI00218070ED
MSVAISVRETVEICSNGESENIIDFNKEQWKSMTDQEKNKWIKRYLYKIKREILVVYRMILDYRGGDVLEDELSELSSISSMIDIKPTENLKSTTVQNDYLTAMVQLKELQERHKEMLIALEDMKNDNAAMSARINVEKTDQEIQTEGVRVEKIERDLDNARGEISSMCSKLELTDDLVESLRRELKEKIRELEETKSAVTNLCSQIEYLKQTIDEANLNVSNRQKRIEDLCEEKNKLKAEFTEANKERNEATEELIVLKDNSVKMMKELKDLRTKANEKRSEYVVDSMRLSSQIDEINEKKEAIISKHENLINNLTIDSIEQNQKIISLEAKKIALEEELKSWENRAGCWINTFVRDEFESKINEQKKEIENLTLLTNRLRSAYKISVSEINGLEDNHKKIIQMKQQLIDKQNRVIALVKGLSPYQSKEFVQHKVQDTLNEIFVKYEEDKALTEKLEVTFTEILFLI